MGNFLNLFNHQNAVLGMIHLRALPATPFYDGDDQKIIDQALRELEIYNRAGLDGIMIENMHDIPYLKETVGPEIIAFMTKAAVAIRANTDKPCGLQVLAGANKAALAVAKAAKFEFIRAEGFVFAHVGDEGIIESNAGELLRYRKKIDAENVFVLTDIKKKHSAHAITSDVSIEETAKAAEFFASDGLIITGNATGQQASSDEVGRVRRSTNLPVLIGSGITIDNAAQYFGISDAFIVGSWFKKDGYWKNALDKTRVEAFMKAVR